MAAQLNIGAPARLNLGCGFDKREGWVNADYIAECNPDVCFDASGKWPFPDDTFFEIYASHVFEHIPGWWNAFLEAVRVLRPGGIIHMRVPDESNSSAGTYRDHVNIICQHSFHGIMNFHSGTNAWAVKNQDSVPVRLVHYERVGFKKYNWMPRWLLAFCGNHMRNFVHEQHFIFEKVS